MKDKYYSIIEFLVTYAVTGGWLSSRHNDRDVTARIFASGHIQLTVEHPKFNMILWDGSINDFMLDKDAMLAIFGKGYVCVSCSDDNGYPPCVDDSVPFMPQEEKNRLCAHIKRGFAKESCHCHMIDPKYNGVESYKYHLVEACKLIMDGKCGVTYLYKELLEKIKELNH